MVLVPDGPHHRLDLLILRLLQAHQELQEHQEHQEHQELQELQELRVLLDAGSNNNKLYKKILVEWQRKLARPAKPYDAKPAAAPVVGGTIVALNFKERL